MKHPLLTDEKRAISIEAKGYFYHIQGIYFYIKRDFNNSLSYFEKLRELQEKWQHILEGQNYRYIYVLEHLMLIYSGLKKFDQHRITLARLREIPAKWTNDKARIFVISYQRELDMYINSGEFEKGVALIPEIEKGLEEFEDIIDEANKSLLFFNIVCVYHGASKYRKALSWINKILNNSSMVREDIYSHTHILNLIIHYELGNIDLLDYRIKSAREFLQRKKRLYKFESLVLGFIKQLCSINEKEAQIETCKKLATQLSELFSDPYEKIVLEYIDFISWLESKIEQRSFSEIVKRKAIQK